jgi:hypothetical protein
LKEGAEVEVEVAELSFQVLRTNKEKKRKKKETNERH